MKHEIKKAVISEKSFAEAANFKYTFYAPKTTKCLDIKKFIEELFSVKVLKINSMTVIGKVKTRGKSKGKRSDMKKYILTLPKDTKIDLFEVEKSDEKKKPEVVEKKEKRRLGFFKKASDVAVSIKEPIKKDSEHAKVAGNK